MDPNQSIGWDLGNAPKQSITEVLQNPRAPALELPDISSIDLASSSLTLTPVTPPNLAPAHNINHFEPYLRRYAPLYAAYRQKLPHPSASPATNPEHPVPSVYFSPDFDIASAAPLADLPNSPHEPLSDFSGLPAARAALVEYQRALEQQLTNILQKQAPAIDAALNNIRDLREHLATTAAKLRDTRTAAATLVPHAVQPVADVVTLTRAQDNVAALLRATEDLNSTASAAADVTLMLEAGAYSAAIDRVSAARETLSSPHLTGVQALFPMRSKLAKSLEAIDAALRREFRNALNDGDEAALHEVVDLVRRMGRLSLLQRLFTKEIRDGLSERLSEVDSLPGAVQIVRTAATRAVMLSRIVHIVTDDAKDKKAFENGGANPEGDGLRSLQTDFEELVATYVDKLWSQFERSDIEGMDSKSFVVVTKDASFSEQTCFDEFKAALKFGEQLRTVDELASEIETQFGVEKRGSALRAKMSERQIAFVTSFHRTHVDTITNAVKTDKWQEVKASQGVLRLLAAVMPSSNSNGSSASPAGKAVDGMLVFDGESFRSVNCGLRYLRSMCAYTLLAEQSVTLGAEVARRGAELSRVFNSLVWKAILGVAALQWSGLRSITARHLSLASRTVGLAHKLASRVHHSMENALSASSSRSAVVVPLMRKIENDLNAHYDQLLAKIVEVMLDRLRAHEEALRALPWSKQQEMTRLDIPNTYVTTLCKETAVLHRILVYVLPQPEAIDIFKKVWTAYGSKLTNAYGSLDGGKPWIRERVARDVASLYDAFIQLEISKVSSEAFKPIVELYKRFAKEFIIEDAAAKSKKVASKPTAKSGVAQKISGGAVAKENATHIQTQENVSQGASPPRQHAAPTASEPVKMEVISPAIPQNSSSQPQSSEQGNHDSSLAPSKTSTSTAAPHAPRKTQENSGSIPSIAREDIPATQTPGILNTAPEKEDSSYEESTTAATSAVDPSKNDHLTSDRESRNMQSHTSTKVQEEENGVELKTEESSDLSGDSIAVVDIEETTPNHQNRGVPPNENGDVATVDIDTVEEDEGGESTKSEKHERGGEGRVNGDSVGEKDTSAGG